MSENLRSYTKALYAMDGVVRRAGHADWDAPSPNPEWTARETLGHVIWGVQRLAAEIRGEIGPLEQPEAEVVGDDPILSWSVAMDDLLEALDHQGVLFRVIDTPFGEMTVDDALGVLFVDPLTHAWDVAKALGVEAALPEELVRHGIHILTAVGDAIRGPGLMDDAIDVHDAAAETDRFIAYTGRDPG
jgi:uncharacterized protein (TIGR03086 family)